MTLNDLIKIDRSLNIKQTKEEYSSEKLFNKVFIEKVVTGVGKVTETGMLGLMTSDSCLATFSEIYGKSIVCISENKYKNIYLKSKFRF